jgi:hypothetical protein
MIDPLDDGADLPRQALREKGAVRGATARNF